jgi:hypothetical protein
MRAVRCPLTFRFVVLRDSNLQKPLLSGLNEGTLETAVPAAPPPL